MGEKERVYLNVRNHMYDIEKYGFSAVLFYIDAPDVKTKIKMGKSTSGRPKNII